ncbi:hypothetical protein GGF41_007547 [Coemansia sp. RSA 2531]|nr:hypothetical protein GGF41_007547 [Coemansia sp. RSA 2531]
MSNYNNNNNNQYGENRGYDNQQYDNQSGYNNQQQYDNQSGYNQQQQQYGNQPGYGNQDQYSENRGYENQSQYGENRGFDEQQQGEEGERGFLSNVGNYSYKDETYTDKHGVVHNKIDKSHVVVQGLGVAAAGGLAYTAYQKYAHKDDTPQQQQQYQQELQQSKGNFFVDEDGSIDKSHAAIAGVGVVAAGLLAKKLYDNFEERNLPEEKHGKHRDNNDYKY